MSATWLPSEFSLDYLDQMGWPSAAPTGEAANAIPLQPAATLQSSKNSLKDAQPTTERGTAAPLRSSRSTAMAPAIEGIALSQADLDRMKADLHSARNRARQLLADLEAVSIRMTTDMATHRRCLEMAISSAQASWTADLRVARRALLIALALPFLALLLLSLAAAGATWWWASSEVAAARAERDQVTAHTRQLTAEFCASAAGRRSCRSVSDVAAPSTR
jgi:hypothetical protein